MQRIEVQPGDRYGELTILREVESKGRRRFKCRCDCGRVAKVRLDHLRSGHSTTCGNCGIEYMGKRLSIKAWALMFGIKESTLRARLKVMGIEEALRKDN